MKYILCILACTLLFCFPVYASELPDDVASPSDAASPDMDFDSFFDYINSLIGGPGIEQSSENTLEAEEGPANIVPYDSVIVLSDSDTYTLSNQENYINMLRLDCTINNRFCTLLFSPSYRDQIYIDSANNLWNVGTSQIQGLVVYDTFDPYAISGDLIYLGPCLGNNFSNNSTYGSPNKIRRYYWSSNRLTYDDIYCQVKVDKYYNTLAVSDTYWYIVIFIMLGGLMLSWLKNWRHY